MVLESSKCGAIGRPRSRIYLRHGSRCAAIRAFEVHAVDYSLKPYDKERFARPWFTHAVSNSPGKQIEVFEPLLQSLRSLRPLERFCGKDKSGFSLFQFPTFCGSKPRETMPAYTPPATVTCCGKPWHTWKRASATPLHPSAESAIVNTARISEIRRCSWGYEHHTGRRNGGHVESQILLTSYELCWNPSLGHLGCKMGVGGR